MQSTIIQQGSPTTMAALPAPTYQAPTVVGGAAYGDLNAPIAYNSLQPLTQFQVIQSENQFVPAGNGIYDVTLGKPEQYKDASGNTYYTTSLPNATPVNQLNAGAQMLPQTTTLPVQQQFMTAPATGSIMMPQTISAAPIATPAPTMGSIMMPQTAPGPFMGSIAMPQQTLGAPIMQQPILGGIPQPTLGLPQPTLGFPAQPTMSFAPPATLGAPMMMPQQTFGAPIMQQPMLGQPQQTLGAPIMQQPMLGQPMIGGYGGSTIIR